MNDNLPFNSTLLKDFAKKSNFDLQFRSPNYPRSNGLAEKGVEIAKNIVKKISGRG